MKTTFFLLISIKTFGQFHHFSVKDSKVIWQQNFPTQKTFNELISATKEAGIVANIEISDNKIIGDLKPIEADYRGAGHSRSNTPIYIVNSRFTAFIIIEFSNDHYYTVLIKKINFTAKSSNGLMKQDEQEQIEVQALKNKSDAFKNIFLGSASEILDFSFTKMFTF